MHGVRVVEDVAEVSQQPGAERGVGVVLGVERERGGHRPLRPVAAGQVRDGEQRLPGVGRPVLYRHHRLCLAQLIKVGPDP